MERNGGKDEISPKIIHIYPEKEHLVNQSNSSRKTSTSVRMLKRKSEEFAKYQRTVLNNLAYFAGTTTRILKRKSSNSGYYLTNNTMTGVVFYWAYHINALIKSIFLAFLMADYFGPVMFFDKMAVVDYVLCFWLVVIALFIWFRRYPFYEIIQAGFKVVNSIYAKLGCPEECLEKMNQTQKTVAVTHFLIIWVGCSCLMSQYVADPKYCTFTFSSFEWDNNFLRIIFGVHEFWFMELAWNAYAVSHSYCIFQGIALSSILDEMTNVLKKLYPNEVSFGKTSKTVDEDNLSIKNRIINPKEVAFDTEYDIEKLLFDYKKLMIISDQYNNWMAYSLLIMQICGGFQFVSAVFSGMHILKKPGAGFIDVYFYIQDSFTGGFMLTRTYRFMSLPSKASKHFLETLKQYLKFQNPKRLELRKKARSLRVISLKVGPCGVRPLSTLAIMNTLSNYWVAAALWLAPFFNNRFPNYVQKQFCLLSQ